MWLGGGQAEIRAGLERRQTGLDVQTIEAGWASAVRQQAATAAAAGESNTRLLRAQLQLQVQREVELEGRRSKREAHDTAIGERLQLQRVRDQANAEEQLRASVEGLAHATTQRQQVTALRAGNREEAHKKWTMRLGVAHEKGRSEREAALAAYQRLRLVFFHAAAVPK